MTDSTTTETPIYARVLISSLVPSKLNVRPAHTQADIIEMAASIRINGIINAPSIARAGENWEIIAGQLRIEGARLAEMTMIDCNDVTALGDAARIELSLAENVTRKDMTPLQLHKAFTRLFKAGRTIEQLAHNFDVTEKRVRQNLAIGGLPTKLIKAVEAGEIDEDALEALTTGTKEQQLKYANMMPRQRPQSWRLDEWLRGKKGRILVARAIFPIDQYKGTIVEDFFSRGDNDVRYFADTDEFFKLQAAEVKKQVDAHRARGWEVIEIDRWDALKYSKKKKAAGGKMFYIFDLTRGGVSFYSGYAETRKSTSASKAKSKPVPKPEISQSFQWFLRAVRHAAVQDALIDSAQVTLALAVTQIIAPHAGGGSAHDGDRYNVVRSDRQKKSLKDGAHYNHVDVAYAAMIDELGAKKILMYRWDRPDAKKLLLALLEYDVPSLQYFLSVALAFHMSVAGNPYQHLLAEAMEIDQVDEWKADDAFWSGINSRDTLLAIVKELGIKSDVGKSTMAQLRTIARKAAPADWRPKWLRFPGGYYAKKTSGLFLLSRNQ